MATAGPVAADESTWEMPDAWRRIAHPRRDRPWPWPRARIDAAAAGRARALVEAARAGVEDVLALPGTTPELAEHGRACLKGEADALGAAVVATVAVSKRGLGDVGGKAPFLDAWAAEHGLPFAAAAYAELCDVTSDYVQAGSKATWTGARRALPSDYQGGWWAEESAARHLRALLAAADDDVHARAVEELAVRRRTPLQRMVVSYLVPTRRDWLDEVRADPAVIGLPPHSQHRWMLFCSLGDPAQVDPAALPLGYYDRSTSVVATLVDGVGPSGAVPLVAGALEGQYTGTDTYRKLLDVLALLPVDEAFQALLDRIGHKYVQPAVIAAARAQPRRALRLLASAAGAPEVEEVLRAHLLTHPELVEEMLPELPEESRAAVGALRETIVRAPEASAGALPPLLVDPPWTRPRTKAKPVVIKDLASPGTRLIAWEPGERDAWTVDLHHLWRWVKRLEWPVQIEKFRNGALPSHQQPVLFIEAPEDLVRPLLAGWEPPDPWYVVEWMRVVVARFELDALDPAVFAARRDPAGAGAVLLPFLSDEVARLMADWLVRLKQAGRTAQAWFRRHGTAAVPALVPPALGKAGAQRRAAEAALRLLADRHGAEAVVAAARVHGDRAADAIEALVTGDPLEVLPAKPPYVGDWADVRLLPQILLRGRGRALPDSAARHVLTMLAMSRPGEAYAGVDVVRDLCDGESLAEFGWRLFRQWETQGAPSKDGWALAQLGVTGDDETVRRLTPVIRAWPGDGGHSKAVAGLDVLAGIGTDVALMHLHGIAQRVKFKALRARAQEKIEEVAAGLELTAGQLADRLVPDFGLDADGTLTLDYGPRRFVVGFDEQLKPYVADEGGARRKALPKPGAKDDPELAPAAYKAFSTLKKDVRSVAADQLRRLEAAMVAQRRWPVREFRELLAGHPLVRHLVRRLVWLASDGGEEGARTTAFRVAEDGTFADADDETVEIADTARVRVAHPVDLGGSLAAWSEVFADYEILQPFPQLGRPVHALASGEGERGRLERFEGLTVPVGKVLGLTSRGWDRGVPQDAGVEPWISRRLPGGRYIVIDLDPGIAVGAVDALPDQKLDAVGLADRPEQRWLGGGATGSFSDLDPVTLSEILADLATLT
ncbi:hypothetical protein BKA00_002793 [Actinomadura coerulea]|uniref:DUF4132 domain-containing protein n=1 Tax=Actinomadura coerulea TaxID=46159 RepID=A0A7X0FYH8_9ACTN|nr:DUF4132 domain-containing protein [Actinomadura coerulea]MBB6395879.1 hypothetical protein [Actinomadura coerulea]GGQ30114.1 hypothetical protein GCM10010187_53530 [Actinomadura coerulea]